MAGDPRMRLRAEVLNVRKFLYAISNEKRRARENDKTRIVVGFSAPYAIFVHEDAVAIHRVGQYKFLETAAIETADEVGEIIAEHMRKKNAKMYIAQRKAGHVILTRAQELCPVSEDGSGGNPAGFLRDSGFVVVEKE